MDKGRERFYERLLAVLRRPVVRQGDWQLLECVPAWEGNWTSECFVAFAWHNAAGERLLVAVNYAPTRASVTSACHPRMWLGAGWRLEDLLGDATHDRDSNGLAARELYLDVAPWTASVLSLTRRQASSEQIQLVIDDQAKVLHRVVVAPAHVGVAEAER